MPESSADPSERRERHGRGGATALAAFALAAAALFLVLLAIPRIGVRTPLMALALDRDGSVGVPPAGDRRACGPVRASGLAGESGTAVIIGDVDKYRGLAVFSASGWCGPATAWRFCGSTASFRVGWVREHSKASFPSAAVYGPSPVPVLRLVTCGGALDPVHRSYRDVVVEAGMVRQP